MNNLRRIVKKLPKKYNPLLLNNYICQKIPSGGLSYIGQSSFSPLSVPNMKIWCEADYGVTLSGSDITSWLDKSGNNNHMLQSNALYRPSISNNSINGLPAIEFNDTDEGLQSTVQISGLSNMTFFVVYKRSVDTDQIVLLGDANTYQYLQYTSTFLIGNAGKNSPMTNDVWYLKSGTGSAVNNEFFTNGVSEGTEATAGGFSYFRFLGDPGGANAAPLLGKIYGFMIFDRVLTSTEITNIDGYWNNKLSIY